jgi:hypothetical protein
MKIITYSDLHLGFGSGWMLPPDANGDVMIMAGDIITLRDYDPLDQLLQIRVGESRSGPSASQHL